MRRRIALAVIVLHCLLLWLLVVGFRSPVDRPQAPQLQVVSLWITPPEPPEQLMPIEAPPDRRRARTSSAQPVPVAPLPAIAPVTPPLEPRPNPNAPPATAPLVDWGNESSLVARSAGNAIGAPPAANTFSEPPRPLPKPCVPKESSLQWKSEQPRSTGSCGLTLGYSCKDRDNWHLFDDMKDPQRAPSSVPHPTICD